jgi:Tfp pilus assembly protein FimT
MELLVIVAIIGLMLKIAMPNIQNTLLNYRLGAASASVAGAIQQTRYRAVMNGCYYTIAFTAGSTTYLVQTQAISGTPPVCATNGDTSPKFTNADSWGAVPWTTGAGLSVVTSTTLEFGSSGIVGTPPSPATNPLVPCAPNCSFQLSNGNATRTVTISGVGEPVGKPDSPSSR